MKTIKFILFFLLVSNLQAQHSEQLNTHFSSFDDDLGWVKLKAENHYSSSHFFNQTYQAFGLEHPEDMRLIKESDDHYGWHHHRYHQYHQQIRVEGATYILHERNGRVEKANGNIIAGIALNTTPNLSAKAAIEKALSYHPARHYKWENEAAEAQIKSLKKNPLATHYPSPELVIVDREYPNKSGQLALAYKMTIYATQPLARHLCWIDAHTGSLIQSYNLMHNTSIDGTANTRYHGEQTISTSLNSDGLYVLRDTSRGGGITTLDVSDEYNSVDFTDDDNFWNNFNANQDEVATDAHFGATATYDFFFNNFNFDSYDGQGSELVSNVHYGNDFNNAFWDGATMTYGDGDGVLMGPLTAIDVCGHEVTHGVTEFTAGLVYAYESGALNESFSDIFGKTIEFLYVPDGTSWVLGERMFIDTTAFFRDMANPNMWEDPKFYKGDYWFEGTGDSGGVHTNSGVQNYWYYLLCEGFSGMNEAGQMVTVPAIGMDKAMRIAFRNLSVYLTEDSQYADARTGSLEAAGDIYGFCSPEYLAVAAAWQAVGIGYSVQDNDYLVAPEMPQPDACDLTEMEVAISLFNNGCTEDLPSGTTIPVYYQVDNMPVVMESITLGQALTPTSSFAYTFSQKAVISGYGEHEVKVWAEIPGDVEATNNSSTYTFLNRPFQNEEFAQERSFASTGFCDEDPDRLAFAVFQYQGCDTLPSGTMVPYELSFKNIFIEDEDRVFQDLPPFGNIFIFENIEYNDYGFGQGSITVKYPGDPDASNNSIGFFLARLLQNQVGWIEPFSMNTMDSTHLVVIPGEASVNGLQEVDGDYRLVMSGSDILDDEGELLVEIEDDPARFFGSNRDFHTSIGLCLDLRGMISPHLSFDLAQTHSNTDYSSYGINPDFSTMLSIFIDGQRIDTLIYGDFASPDFQFYEYDLSDYTDTIHEVRITTLNLTASGIPGQLMLDGDNNIIDNIKLTARSTGVSDPELAALINIFPNPSTGSFQVSRRDSKEFGRASVQLFDAAGRLLSGLQIAEGTTHFSFGEDLVAGLYMVKLVDEERTIFSKVVKQ